MNNDIEEWKTFFSKIKRQRDLIDGYLRFVERCFEKRLPPIFEIRHLSQMIGIKEHVITHIIANPADHYRSFTISKRRGGSRTISSPLPSLKAAQDWIHKEILYNIDVHDSAYGFVKGRSVVDNAKFHLGASTVLRIDFSDFFGSINYNKVLAFFSSLGYPPNVSYGLARICTLDDKLPQGASTSPALSNMLCRSFDEKVTKYASEQGISYTRYADDITLSGEEISISPHLDRISAFAFESDLEINHAKTLLSRSNRKIVITGVSISNGKMALPRKQVRSIKSDAHFILKYGVSRAIRDRGKNDLFYVDRVLGRISFWLQIDPHHQGAIKLRNRLIDMIK